MNRYIETSKGFLISPSQNLEDYAFIRTKNAEEIEMDTIFSLVTFIYEPKEKIERTFQNPKAKSIHENENLEKIIQKISNSIGRKDEFEQDCADMEWQMSMAIHHRKF
ncbi:MAG: hypothetical protein KBD48_00865 [Candidatus Pacebacteria bacterium]|nr:hypothetical protein [Candidatus Paceibacterota bacterium]MBP9715729.1 hypothetical protein [Candidatus Paceibacterota bacterium]